MISNKKLDNQLIKLPNDIKFCQKCVISNQRPRIQFNKCWGIKKLMTTPKTNR